MELSFHKSKMLFPYLWKEQCYYYSFGRKTLYKHLFRKHSKIILWRAKLPSLFYAWRRNKMEYNWIVLYEQQVFFEALLWLKSKTVKRLSRETTSPESLFHFIFWKMKIRKSVRQRTNLVLLSRLSKPGRPLTTTDRSGIFLLYFLFSSNYAASFLSEAV